jgi:hypothetical protein
MIQQLDVPDGLLGVRPVGRLTAEDYATVIAPLVEEVRRRLRCLIELGPDFTGVTPGAAWQDVRLGFRAMCGFDGCAVLTDLPWLRRVIRFVAHVRPYPLRVFGEGTAPPRSSGSPRYRASRAPRPG